MNWDAIGAIGEILGAFVVVATLVYLSRQIAQQATALKNENMGTWLSDYNSLALRVFDSQDTAEIVRRGLSNFESLSGTDKIRFHAWIITHALNAQTMYLQQEENVMNQQITETILPVNASLFKLNGGNQWWQRAKKTLDPKFVEEMDRRISATAAASDAFPYFVLDPEEMNHLADGQVERNT